MIGYGYSNEKGNIREGMFEDGILNGYGTFKCDGFSYEGQLQKGKRHGWGVCREGDQEYEATWATWKEDELVSKTNNSSIILKMN